MAGDVGKMGRSKRIIHVDFAHKAIQSCPWLDERGFPLSEKSLKLRSKCWTPQIWGDYLHSLEVPQREPVGYKKDGAVILTEHANSEDGLEASTRHLYEYEPERHQWMDRAQSLTSVVKEETKRHEAEPVEEIEAEKDEPALVQIALLPELEPERAELDLYSEVQVALGRLTRNEALVVFRMYWEGESEREIGVIMRRSRRSVRVWKDRAFSKLKPILSPILHRYEGESVSKDLSPSKPVIVTPSKSS